MSFMKGVSARSSADTNNLQKNVGNIDERAGSPVDTQLRISYGRIIEVNQQTSQVKVAEFTAGDDRILGATRNQPDGTFIPILQPLHIIHMQYGLLRKNMCVRIFWRGKNQPGSESIVEVIGDEDCEYFKTGKKEPQQNVITIGSYKVLSGGLVI